MVRLGPVSVLVIITVVGLSSSLPISNSHVRDLLEILRTSKRLVSHSSDRDSSKRYSHDGKQRQRLSSGLFNRRVPESLHLDRRAHQVKFEDGDNVLDTHRRQSSINDKTERKRQTFDGEYKIMFYFWYR